MLNIMGSIRYKINLIKGGIDNNESILVDTSDSLKVIRVQSLVISHFNMHCCCIKIARRKKKEHRGTCSFRKLFSFPTQLSRVACVLFVTFILLTRKKSRLSAPYKLNSV